MNSLVDTVSSTPDDTPIGWGGNPQKRPSSRDWSLTTDNNYENLFTRPPKPDALGIFLIFWKKLFMYKPKIVPPWHSEKQEKQEK